ncbi:MAG: glycosyltransferase [Clostridiales bacterium]|nr:glycosyltransferase [Clostridiales bacterium]
MKRCLILLTVGFPFGSGETFLESEIEYLRAGFDRIIIFAQDIDSSEKTMRKIPDGVEAYNIAMRSKKAGRVSDLFGGILKLFMPTAEYYADKKYVGLSPFKKYFLEYFETRSKRHFSEMLNSAGKDAFSDFDEFVIYSYWFFTTARCGMMLKNHLDGKRVVFISRAHGYDVYDYINRLSYLPERETLLNSVDRLFVCSKCGCEYLRGKYPEFADKICHTYLGTTDHGVTAHKRGDVFRIVTCSRLIPLKRVDKVAAALRLLKNSGLKFSWTHIGGGHEFKKIKKYADKNLGFMDVSFKEDVPNSDVFGFYSDGTPDIFINVSKSEGVPVSIMEAASFGIPAIATDVGGNSEIVENGVSGFLIKPDFLLRELADKILAVARLSDGEYDALRSNARKIWEERFSAEKNYRSFSETISDMLS